MGMGRLVWERRGVEEGENDQGRHSWWFRASRAQDESRNNRNMRPSGWVTPTYPTGLASTVSVSE